MRRLVAEIEIDEEVADRYAETNGIEDSSPVAFLEHEFGWLEQSGITLNYAYIADEDDTEERAKYINYIMEWAQERAEDFERTDSPLTYEAWQRADKGLELMFVVNAPKTLAVDLIRDLGNGEPTERGDRTSRYFQMARDQKNPDRAVKVALIEQVHGLDYDMRGYAIHVIDDVEMRNCEIFHTEHLDRFELEKLLDRVYDDFIRRQEYDRVYQERAEKR